jgi:hypothetical protein
VGDERRGARGGASVERGTVNSYVGERNRGSDWGAGDRDRRPRQLGKINVRLRNASAGHADTDRMSARLARVGMPGRRVLTCKRVMVLIRCCRMIVIVRRRPMVVIRVIMPAVLMDVQRRRHGRRDDQGLNEHECHDPAHGDSVLRPADRTSAGYWNFLGSECLARLHGRANNHTISGLTNKFELWFDEQVRAARLTLPLQASILDRC